MAKLIEKKLAQLPIGTFVELTYQGEGTESVSGAVTDNDFSSALQITPENGPDLLLDYGAVRSFSIRQTLEKTLQTLPVGARIFFSYGGEDAREPDQRATVTDNDGESGLELRLAGGGELLLDYAAVRSLLVEDAAPAPAPKPAPQPAPVPAPVPKPAPQPQPEPEPAPAPKPALSDPPLYLRVPDDALNLSDTQLKDLFGELSKEDRKYLSGFYESFKQGVKTNDRGKTVTAARNAQDKIWSRLEAGSTWSRQAYRFCGCMLRRAHIYDWEIFLEGRFFLEAALVCRREDQYTFAGAYAILAMLEQEDAPAEDLMAVLAWAVVRSDDVSALRLLYDRLPEGLEDLFMEVVREAFARKGVRLTAEQQVPELLGVLETLCSNTEMEAEVKYWFDLEPETGAAAEPEPPLPKADSPKILFGEIVRLEWGAQAGVISGDDGESYSFRYDAIKDTGLRKSVLDCTRSELGEKSYSVRFEIEDGKVKDVYADQSYVNRAIALTDGEKGEERAKLAFELCRRALQTSDISKALEQLMRLAMLIYESYNQASYVKEAIQIYDKNEEHYPTTSRALLRAARCFGLKKPSRMLELADRALDGFKGGAAKRLPVLEEYLRILRERYDAAPDPELLRRQLARIGEADRLCAAELTDSQELRQKYVYTVNPYRVYAECCLDMPEEAAEHFAALSEIHPQYDTLKALLKETKKRCAQARRAAEQETGLPEGGEPADGQAAAAAEEFPAEEFPGAEGEEIPEEEIQPYRDADGWAALKLTKKDVVDYAIGIGGEARIPSILAYLRAGASLWSEIGPVYRLVALAVNDPMENPDYSLSTLLEALTDCDQDYPELNDYCLAASFLRASFSAGMGYDFNAKSIRDSITACSSLPVLREVYDLLAEFRMDTGRAVDIYADYRNEGSRKLAEDMELLVREARELYVKYVQSPARDSAVFARAVETKRIIFDKDGDLARLLSLIIDRKQAELEKEKEDFRARFLTDNGGFSASHISDQKVYALIEDSFEQAADNLRQKKGGTVLQGKLRNNLRSNIGEILRAVCRWYQLSEQSAGLTWKTEEGEKTYQRLKPRLLENLQALSSVCTGREQSSSDPQERTGLFLLGATAAELAAQLDGSWRFGREKYFYADFLRSGRITLNEDFLPELSSTFCVLPEFNVLARIRRHAEGPRLSFQARIDQIYGTDKTANDYGSAELIRQYLENADTGETAVFPADTEKFTAQTEKQVERRFRSFRETYALAMNYGQIIKSDTFCYTLEETVRYWYDFCRRTKNYGFFNNLLLHAENQIHASAGQYEDQLNQHLDALIAGNQAYFDDHPDYAEAIRSQIGSQNFTVAEDWMARIRIGDFSPDVQQPEALAYLEDFWNNFVEIYKRVNDAGRPLVTLLSRREVRNKDTKGARQLIDNWLNSGRPASAPQIEKLLNLLGWQNLNVEAFPLEGDPGTELYKVRKARNLSSLTMPQHPIAAFGSALEVKPMYVACLYGGYDCDRLCEKIRTLDAVDGNKVILLDYALGSLDRRALAKKLKYRESGFRNVYLLIDRVLITHLANNYNENLINRILMAIAMPFSYCQPYVVDSQQTMPPEIFIGRKDELLKIEKEDGVNLIYGGRQLGKSALFKKALADIDGREGKRAVHIELNKLNCAESALKVSQELIDLGITPDAEPTDDWQALCRTIKQRLRKDDGEDGGGISYLLLMLDEADTFIDDCAACGYRPLLALKDVQQSVQPKFKYVLAGLHNIIKFNRQVALGNNSVITHIPSLKITPFRTPEAQELLTQPLSYLGFSLPSKVTVSQILATCNYFPGLIQLYAQKLIESVRTADYAGYDMKQTPPYVVSDAHLRRVMSDKEFVEEIYNKFEITLKLDMDQGSCYYPLTLLIGWMYNEAPAKNGYTAADVLSCARSLQIPRLQELDEEKIDALLQELQDLNILRSVTNNSYLLASKNFRDLLGTDEEIMEKLTTTEEVGA